MTTPNVAAGTQGTGAKPTLEEIMEAKAAKVFGILGDDEDTPAGAASQTQDDAEQPEEQDAAPPADDAEPTEQEQETEQAADEQPASSRKVKYADGEEKDVTVDEAYAGHLRQKDYTQKTQAVAAERKEVAQIKAEAASKRDALVTTLTQAEIAVRAMLPENEPDWDEMAESLSPAEVLRAQGEHRKYKQQHKAITDRIEQERQAQFAEAQEAAKEVTAAENLKLLEKFPAWSDPAQQTAHLTKLATFAESVGFTKAELRTLTDHRAFVLLDLAMKGAAKGKAPAGAPAPRGIRTGKPSAPPKPAPPTSAKGKALADAKGKLAKSGSRDNAVNYFNAMLAAKDQD